jgi:hypothetical protein
MMPASRASFSLGVLSLGAVLCLSCQSQESAEAKNAPANAPVVSVKPAETPKSAAAPADNAVAAQASARGPSAEAVASALVGSPPAAGTASAGTQPASASAPAAAAEGSTVKGSVSTGEGFAVHLEAQGSYTVGKPSSVTVVLKAAAPFHCNDKYPYKFTPTPSAGLTFKEAVARGMNIAPSEATMDVGFTSTQAGKLTLSGELSFSVCTEDRCLVEKQPLSVTVNVKDAS